VSRLRTIIGATLRRRRQSQARTLREVAEAAGVSLTYLSEVERGCKEASSEILEAVCAALGLVLSDLLFEVASELVRLEVRGSLPRIGFIPDQADQVRARPPTRSPASARSPPVIVERPVPEPAAPAPVARVIDLRAYAGRRSA
jgi:transcriptional regulator with XRE-family HTH domain